MIKLLRQSPLTGRPLPELLHLVGDAERGYKMEALDLITAMDLDRICPELERAVRDNDDADLRNGAMEVLVKLGRRAVPKLTPLLRDADEEIRNFAAVMLGDIGSREAVESLVAALADPDCNVSHSAAEALGKIADRSALVPLLQLLKGDFWLRFPAVSALGELRDYRAIPHLLQLLDDELLRGAVIEALGKIGDPRALYPLAAMLPLVPEEDAGGVVRALVAIHGNLTDELSYKNKISCCSHPERMRKLVAADGVARLKSMLEGGDEPETVQAAVLLLGWLGELSALPLFFRLLADQRFLQVVENAVVALGVPAQQALGEALEHESVAVRMVALRAMRWHGISCAGAQLARLLCLKDEALQLDVLEMLLCFPDEMLLPQLRELLSGGNEQLAAKAAAVVGRLGAAASLELFGALARSPRPYLRRRAALLLSEVEGGGGRETLELLWEDENAEVRRTAVRAVGAKRVAEALPLLARALGDPELAVREAAVLSAADFGEPVLLHEIIHLLGSGGESLDYCVIKALGEMGARDARGVLMDYLERGGISRRLEYAVIEALGKVGCKEASPLVSGYLRHEDADFRRLALQTLGVLADRESLQRVEEATRDPHWSVRIAALHVLGEVGGGYELPLVIRALKDSDPMVRRHAVTILGDMANTSAVPDLVLLLADPELGKPAFEALLRFGRSALPWLHRLMKRNYTCDLRERVIDVIGKIADPRSVEPLLEQLEDENETIRLAAIDSLSHCFDTFALKRLIQVKADDRSEEVRGRAELALRSFALQDCLG